MKAVSDLAASRLAAGNPLTSTQAGLLNRSQQELRDLWGTAEVKNPADWAPLREAQAMVKASKASTTSDGIPTAKELWDQSNKAWEEAKAASAADRDKMLGELQTYQAGLGNGHVDEQVSREAARWQARNAGVLAQVTQQMAMNGRTVSPYILGEIRRRLVAQTADAVQVTRIAAESELNKNKQYYLTTLNGVLSNTENNLLDPVQAAALIRQMVTPQTVSFGGGGSSTSSSTSSQTKTPYNGSLNAHGISQNTNPNRLGAPQS